VGRAGDKMEKEKEKIEEKPEPKASPREAKMAGKTFDISTSEGVAHMQGWGDAMGTLVGKQGEELGQKRKFEALMKPTESQEETLKEITQLREDGEHGKADHLLLAYTRRSQREARNELRVEREKDKFLKSYLNERKEILNTYDEEDFRTLTESQFDFASGVSFEDLDNHWLPKVRDKKIFDAASPVETPETVVQSTTGGRAPAEKVSTEPVPEVQSLDDIFNEIDPYRSK